MKAQDLWAGHEYAYKEGKPRGVETPQGALRVKLLKTERKQQPWNQRMSTLATVEILDKETGETTGVIRTVRARDIFDWWVDYSDRLTERQRRIDEAKAEEVRIKQERENELAVLRTKLHIRTGIPQDLIHFDVYGGLVLNKHEIKEWLNA